MTDSDYVIAKIAEFFKYRFAKMQLTRIFTSLEGGKLEYIQTGIKNHLANPDEEKWQDFIQALFDKHDIKTEEAPKLITWFSKIGISVKEKETDQDRSNGNQEFVKLEADFNLPPFSIGNLIQTAKKVVPLSFPSDLNLQLNTVLTCLSYIYIIENSFRLLIIELEKKGTHIEFTSKIKVQIDSRKQKEKDWVPLRGGHDIFWTTLGELIKLFKSHINQKQFEKVGLSQSRIEDIIAILNSLSPFRNVSAHFPLYFPQKDFATILNGEWTKFKFLFKGLYRDGVIKAGSI